MQKFIGLIAICFLLSSCGLVHKMDIEQGNVLTQDMVNRIHTGMTQAEVKNVMGSPMLLNTFNNERIDYVYTYKPGGGQTTEKYITLTFKKGVLREIKGNLYSEFIK